MRVITDIYKEYKIPKNLEEHQFRVTAVASQICDSMTVSVNKKNVITACLVHDMGNIIKFNLSYFPQFLEPEGYDYWKNVQDEFKKKYGADEHHATLQIIRKLGMPDSITQIVDAIGFPNWINTNFRKDLESKICTYADARVTPHGIAKLEERLAEGAERYKGTSVSLDLQRDGLYEAIRAIEKEIFSNSTIGPEDITNESVKKYIEDLKNITV